MKADNRRVFGPAIKPLVKQEYVLRMAAANNRPWSQKAQAKHLLLWRERLREALDATEKALADLPHRYEGPYYFGHCLICGRTQFEEIHT